ncbi:MAG: hypothetical protein ACREBG_06200 [Pyrinomonadaceae bacterium]
MDTEAPTPEIEQLKSWLPVDAIVRNGRPGIEWMDMSGVVLAEPFFSETVDRVRKEKVGTRALVTDFAALIRLEKISDSLQPSGFIFHSSRSGSTLVANACRALRDALVVAEAPAIDKLISRFFTDTDADGTKELFYSVFLRGAVSALGQRRLGNERHYFVKFASTSTLQFARIRRVWPTVPAVFLFRDPIEVMVSNMRSLPQWMVIESNPATAAAIIGVSLEEVMLISPEEFCARALGGYYAAVEAIADEHTLLINYDQLTPNALLQVVRFFGVSPSAEEIDAIIETCRPYSKDPTRTQVFRPDGAAKRADASDLTKEMVEKWALPSYRRLTKLQMHRTAAK